MNRASAIQTPTYRVGVQESKARMGYRFSGSGMEERASINAEVLVEVNLNNKG